MHTVVKASLAAEAAAEMAKAIKFMSPQIIEIRKMLERMEARQDRVEALLQQLTTAPSPAPAPATKGGR